MEGYFNGMFFKSCARFEGERDICIAKVNDIIGQIEVIVS